MVRDRPAIVRPETTSRPGSRFLALGPPSTGPTAPEVDRLAQLEQLVARQQDELQQQRERFAQQEEQITRFWCGKASIPYLGRADIGHDSANRIVPFGPL